MSAVSAASNSSYDVAIVGYGPVGAVAAGWFGSYGIRTLVIDKSQSIWTIPRAIALDHEIMRVFQNLGCVEQVEPFTSPFPASEHYGVQGQLIRRVDVVPKPYPLGYPPTLVFTQPEVERVLREHVAKQASVDVLLGVELVAAEQHEDGVILRLRHDNGAEEERRAAYLIGCDGASSFVRQHLGIALEDMIFDEPWIVVDVVVNEDALDQLPATAAQFCNPERPTTFIIGPGSHRRWEIMLRPDEDPRVLEQDENVWQLLSPWLQPGQGRLWRASSYRFHALVAKSWRSGRVFLAGDAAHQQPPFIGQGMCQGIRDVTNLAWKLHAVLRGGAPDALLDTYGKERKRHVEMLTERIKTIGQHICERDLERALQRDEDLLRQGGGVAPVVTRQEIVPGLTVGLLSAQERAGRGTLFPQPWVVTPEGDQRLDELTGHGWRLFFDGARTERPQAENIAPVEVGGTGLQERDAVLRTWFDRNGCVAALVRPDHYVYGTAASAEDTRLLVSEIVLKLGEPALADQSLGRSSTQRRS